MRRIIAGAASGLLILALATPAATASSRIDDGQQWSAGAWSAMPQPWGAAAGQKAGVDYLDTIEIGDRSPRFVMRWHWPLQSAAGVKAYDAVRYGVYWGNAVQTPVAPRRVRDIVALSEAFDTSWLIVSGDFDGLIEAFLSSTPVPAPDGSTQTHEVAFFTHAANVIWRWATSCRSPGSFVSGGQTWEVRRCPIAPGRPDEIMMLPRAPGVGDYNVGTADFKAAFDFLIAKGEITGAEYYTGHAHGVEPISGAGGYRINAISVDYR